MSLQVTNLEAVGNLGNLRSRLIDEMAAFARKTSVPHADKILNAEARRLEMASLDRAIAALLKAEALDIDLKTP